MELQPFITAPADALQPEAVHGGALHGHRQGKAGLETWTRIKEQPWHIHAARYFALEMTPQQVAMACEVDRVTITELLKNDWFQERITQFLHEGNKDIMALLNAEAMNSLQVMVEIRDNDKVAPQTRLASAKSLLEWKLGKPTQRTEVVSSTTSTDPNAEVAALEAELGYASR